MYRVLPIAGLLLLVVAGAVFLMRGSAAAASAAEIVERCKGHPEGAAVCYEEAVPKLYPQAGIPQLFTLIREIRRQNPSYQFCHVLAHKLGEAVVAEDRDAWLDAIPLNPTDGMCSNGFIHGVIVGRFRDDSLDEETLQKTIPDFARACEPRANWNPSGLDQAICYHGMGHLLMFITDAGIRRSLEACDTIANSPTGDFLRVCREGVFMQIYQPLEPDDFALVELLPEKPTRENYRRLCATYQKDEEEGACLREAWPLFQAEIREGTGVQPFCSGQPNKREETACFESVMTIIGRQSLGNSGGAADACEHVPRERQALCYTVVAQAVVEEDRTQGERALDLCRRAAADVAAECIRTLASRASWLFAAGSPEHAHFCALVPKEDRAMCAGGR